MAFLAFALCAAAPEAGARPKRDIIHFKNGDRMTCEIKTLSNLRLTVAVDYIDGNIPVDWSLIERIESDQQFIVELLDGIILSGLLQTTGSAGQKNPSILVTSPREFRQVETMEVSSVRQDEQRWYQRLHGSADLSWIYARANDQTQLATNANITYTNPRWDASAETHSNFNSVAGVESGDRTQNTVQATRYFGRRWLAAGFTDFLKSAEQNLDLRTIVGGGGGRDLIRGHRTRLRVLAGLVSTRERYSEASGGTQQSSVEAVLSGTYSFFTFKNANFFGTVSLYPSLSDAGRYRIDTSMSSKVKIFKDVTINFSLYSNYDSRPPAGGLGVDYGANTGVGYVF